MKKKVLSLVISFLIGLGIFFWILRVVGLEEIKEITISFLSLKGLLILILTFLIWVAGSWKWQFILGALGCYVPLRKLVAVVIAAFSISYIFSPAAFLGNLSFRAWAAKRKLSLPWNKNVSSVVIGEVLDIVVLFFFLILGSVSFFFLAACPFSFFKISIIALAAGLAFVLVLFFFWIYKKKSLLGWLLKIVKLKKKDNKTIWEIEKNLTEFLNCRKAFFWKALGLSFLKYAAIFSRLLLVIYFLGGGFNLLVTLAVMFVLYLSYLFPLPASLGALEAGQVFVFRVLGRGVASGLGLSFVLRGADTILTLVGIIFLWKIGIKFLFKKSKEVGVEETI